MQLTIIHEPTQKQLTCASGQTISNNHFTIQCQDDKVILTQIHVGQVHFITKGIEMIINSSEIPYTLSSSCKKFLIQNEIYRIVKSFNLNEEKDKNSKRKLVIDVDLEAPKKKRKLVKNKKNNNELVLNVDYPNYWEEQVNDCQCFELDKESEEFKYIVGPFLENGNVDVLRIERLQNKRLYGMYAMRKFFVDGNIDTELLLYHGTNSDHIQNIVKEGLDHRLAKMTGLIGVGVYFAEKPKEAINYAFSNTQEKHLLVCRVFLGKSVAGHSGLRRPPYLPGTNDLADSVHGHIGTSKIYAVFDNNQSYPEYIVHFKSKGMIMNPLPGIMPPMANPLLQQYNNFRGRNINNLNNLNNLIQAKNPPIPIPVGRKPNFFPNIYNTYNTIPIHNTNNNNGRNVIGGLHVYKGVPPFSNITDDHINSYLEDDYYQ
jgi:hypothetical protein